MENLVDAGGMIFLTFAVLGLGWAMRQQRVREERKTVLARVVARQARAPDRSRSP